MLDPLNRYDVDEIEQVFKSQAERSREVVVKLRMRGDTASADILLNQVHAVEQKHNEIVSKLKNLLQ